MATQSSARLKGDDYQHLLSWYHILSLMKPSYNVEMVKLEDSLAGLVDDVTVYRGGKEPFVDFYQIKFHVDQRESYSIDNLIKTAVGKSIMEKFWASWKKIKNEYPGRRITLNLYSNWLIDPSDVVLKCINGENGCLDNIFYLANQDTAIGKKRKEWREAHNATEEEFKEFAGCLVFHLGKDFTDELKRVISERMLLFNLKNDENALYAGAGIVRDWIKSKTEEISIEILITKLRELDLYLSVNDEKAVAVYFTTIKDRKFDLSPDFILDWRHYFNTVGGKGDHELINPHDWNTVLLPELIQLEERINSEAGANLIRARGFSRLSAWFAIGHTFSEVSGYKLEVSQQDQLWRSDIPPSEHFELTEEVELNQNSHSNGSVAIGISVTGSLMNDVRNYLASNLVDALLFLSPTSGLGRDAIKSNDDVVALATKSKEKIREFVKKHKAQKVLLFYFGPLSGACFIGHQLNAVCKEIQIMENTTEGSYIPSFLLS